MYKFNLSSVTVEGFWKISEDTSVASLRCLYIHSVILEVDTAPCFYERTCTITVFSLEIIRPTSRVAQHRPALGSTTSRGTGSSAHDAFLWVSPVWITAGAWSQVLRESFASRRALDYFLSFKICGHSGELTAVYVDHISNWRLTLHKIPPIVLIGDCSSTYSIVELY